MRLIIAILSAVILAGCATDPVTQEIVTVRVLVREPCIQSAPTQPEYFTGKGEYPGEKDAAHILANDFEKAEQYGRNWEAAAAGCIQ